MLTLLCKSARLDISPSVGAGVISYSILGKPVLRQAAFDTQDPLDLGCFLLLPYCNRIRQGRFHFEGHDIELAPNFKDSPHTLHGQGWQAQWRTRHHTDTEACLQYSHVPDSWPWAYEAVVTYVLAEYSLDCSLKIKNLSDHNMPMGLGFHPYFPRPRSTQIQAHTEGMWLSDDEILPRTLAQGAHPLLGFEDHCHTGFKGPVIIQNGIFKDIVMSASEACTALHIYAPNDQDYMCVEPVTHEPDSFNRSLEPKNRLAPGQTAEIKMRLKVRV